jgi:hypothetical protein
MAEEIEFSQGKSAGDLGHEALWFTVHTAIALLALAVMIGVIAVLNPAPDASAPKLFGTLLAFVLPMAVGFIFAKVRRDEIATYVWISGMLIFAGACVWVLDLPTGNGLCEHCGAFEKLWRTFFSIDNGSGLIAGNGLLVGSWMPLSLFGYSFGARFGLNS